MKGEESLKVKIYTPYDVQKGQYTFDLICQQKLTAVFYKVFSEWALHQHDALGVVTP